MSTSRLRMARLTPDMVDALGAIHMRAFPDYMASRLGVGYVRARLRWFIREPRAIALACFEPSRQQPIGYLVGAPFPGYDRALNGRLFIHAMRSAAFRPWLMFDRQLRGTATTRLVDLLRRPGGLRAPLELPEPAYALVTLAVVPTARRLGAGRLLTERFEAEACRLGARALCLSVYPRNYGARTLYERRGWRSAELPRNETAAMFYIKVFA